jgi:prevent-host-death family protein
MIEVSVNDIKSAFSEYLNRAAYGHERVLILSRGKPKAAMISIADLHRLEELEDALAAAEAVAEHQAGETVPWAQLKAELAVGSSGVSN